MRQMRRIQVRVIAVLIAAVLCICATLFLALATYLALRETMSSIWAALATASLLVALLGWLVTWSLSRRRSRDRREPTDLRDMLEEALQSNADPMLSEWARHNPDRAVIASALLGVAAGYSAPVRRLMRDLYCPAADREDRRRKQKPE